MNSYNSPTTKPIFRASQVIWYILALFEVVLTLRFFLKLLGANPVASFTNLIYSVSLPLVSPFQAVFSISNIEKNIFEWTTLLAMFVYWLVAMGIMQLLFMSKTVSTGEAAQMLKQEEV
ncbi:MAG: YggT family protein [Minisyncoccia bacterium]